ncbi:MAG: hypothetical protein IPK26_13085 [Planctomycetes bacterium]|nr:hypothetical protein [Planctomycetota bacterium]
MNSNHPCYRLLASCIAVVLAAVGLRAQLPISELGTLTQLESMTPGQGATNVPLNQSAGIRATAPLNAHTINEDSVQVTVGGAPVIASYSLSVDARTILIGFPQLLPPNSRVDVTLDCAAIRDQAGQQVDLDLDGRPGGIARRFFDTGNGGNTPPLRSGTAVVLGRVLDGNGNPMPDAVVRGWYYPRLEGQQPLPVLAAQSNATGEFQWTTSTFTGQQSFLVEVSKAGFSEILRRVDLLAGGCARIDDATLLPLAPRTTVDRLSGGTIQDPTGQITLTIPAGALQRTSNIGMTRLADSTAVRDRLPQQVVGGTAGTYVDVAGVFGEATTTPVTMRVPNTYNLPLGTEVPFGKVDHNTLQWVDLRNVYNGNVPAGTPHPALGRVVANGTGGTVIEVRFDEFCTIVCNYCLPIPPIVPNPPRPRDPPRRPCGPGRVPGSSTVDTQEGFLDEVIGLPGFREFDADWSLHLAYASNTASPTVTLRGQGSYAQANNRPVERTLFRFALEGRVIEAAFDRSTAAQRPIARFFWDGRNALGELMPTGSYPFTMDITTLNANVPVAVPATFGGTSVRTFAATYPGQLQLRATQVADRVVLVNQRASAYGAGWSIEEEDRIHIDADGCLVLTYGNGSYHRYTPATATPGTWTSRLGDFTTIVYDPAAQVFNRTFPDGEVHLFARTGLLQRKTTRYGHSTVFAYTGGLLTQVTSPTGFHYRLFYDGAGKLDRVVDSDNRTTDFTIDAAGDLTAIRDVVNSVRQFTYDAEHRMVTNVGPRGERTEYTYSNGRVVRTRQYEVGGTKLLRERTFVPSSLAAEIGAALAAGRGTLAQPMAVHQQDIDAWTDGTGATEYVYRDGEGQVSRVEDPLQRRTNLAYHPDGLQQSRTRPDNSSTHYTYDAQGQPTSVTERTIAGAVYSTATTEYNGIFHQPSRFVDEEGKQTLVTYDAHGSPTTVTDHDGGTMVMVYADARFRQLPTRITSAAGHAEALTYDVHGNVVTSTDFPDPIATPAGRTWIMPRDARGNIASVTDPRSATMTLGHDAFDRLVSIADALLRVTTLRYDDPACGCSASPRLTGASLPNGTTLAFVYDGLGNLQAQTDQLGRTSRFQHDAEGRLTVRTTRQDQRVVFSRDAAGQLVRRTLPDGSSTSYTHDLLGNLASATDARGSVEFTYDSLSRPLTATTIMAIVLPGGLRATSRHVVTYQYDRVGNRTSVADGAGYAASYAYDNLHRLTSLQLTAPLARVWAFTHDADGRLTRILRNNGIPTVHTYDAAGQETSTSHATIPSMQRTVQSRDTAGQITRIDERLGGAVLTRSFTYDLAAQLVAAGDSATFGDARVGQTLTYDAANEILATNEYSFAHDADGRLVRRTWNNRPQYETFDYDAEDRLIRVRQFYTGGAGPIETMTVDYAYDALGRLSERSINGVVTRRLYDGLNPLHETDQYGAITATSVAAPGLDDLLAVVTEGGSRLTHLFTDVRGSVIATADDTGALLEDVQYDEYGQWISGAAGRTSFLGRPQFPETGFHDLRARWYDPTSGRFLTADPVGGVGGLNEYSYALGNPITMEDRLGLMSVAGRFGRGLTYTTIGGVVMSGSGTLGTFLASTSILQAVGVTAGLATGVVFVGGMALALYGVTTVFPGALPGLLEMIVPSADAAGVAGGSRSGRSARGADYSRIILKRSRYPRPCLPRTWQGGGVRG